MKYTKRKLTDIAILAIICLVSLLTFSCDVNNNNDDEPPTLTITTVASGLQAPMGMATGWKNSVLVAETGTAHNDGKIVAVLPGQTAQVYDVVTNLSSIKNALSGEVEGPAHLLYDSGTLYALAGDRLYSIDISSFQLGDDPIDASKLQPEDIGTYVRSQHIVTPNDSHPYNLVKGPDGELFILDAGANALIKRTGAGRYSVFAKFPNFKNPTKVGPPVIQSVPTGIIFDKGHFLVSTLTGFPFLKGKATIYKVTMAGDVSVYQSGLTTLVDMSKGNHFGKAVLHYAYFGSKGFAPNTGSLFYANGDSTSMIADKLNMPAGLIQIDNHSWYVTSLADGSVLKVTYK